MSSRFLGKDSEPPALPLSSFYSKVFGVFCPNAWHSTLMSHPSSRPLNFIFFLTVFLSVDLHAVRVCVHTWCVPLPAWRWVGLKIRVWSWVCSGMGEGSEKGSKLPIKGTEAGKIPLQPNIFFLTKVKCTDMEIHFECIGFFFSKI